MVARQEVAFLEKSRKIVGCGSLKRYFYTKFKPKIMDFGAVTWWKKRWHFGGEMVATGMLFLYEVEQ